MMHGPDGKMFYRGLKPGQQLIQMKDGNFSIITNSQSKQLAPKKLESNKNINLENNGASESMTKDQILVTTKTLSNIVSSVNNSTHPSILLLYGKKFI